MAELIYLCERDSHSSRYSDEDFSSIAERITPTNAPSRVEIVRSNGIIYCLINSSGTIPTASNSVCLGQMIPPEKNWDQPKGPIPDGNYGIVRGSKDTIELVSDMTGSRTIYYCLRDDLFIASSSQRAIMHFMDSFVPNESAIPWMISSGSLGPCESWDQRINALPADSCVQLDRQDWEVTMTNGTTWKPFTPKDRSKEYHLNQLDEAITDTFSNLQLDFPSWHITLSGGVDSREILRRLHSQSGITTGTRTGVEAISMSNTDPSIAEDLADAYEIPHRFYLTPAEPTDVENVFDRMVTLSEGRVATVPRMADGFAEYAQLATNGIKGVIRGDEGFGWTAVGSVDDVRRVVGGEMLSDYDSIPPIPGEESQIWPNQYNRYDDESLPMWRDRLYHSYRGPTYLAAWNSLKTPYIEVVNPLMTRRVLNTVREMPDNFRTEKQLFREYVLENSADIPEATNSGSNLMTFLDSQRSRDFLKTELDTDHARSILGEEIIKYTISKITYDNKRGSDIDTISIDMIKKKVGRHLPSKFNQMVLAHTPLTRPDPTQVHSMHLAVRLYTIQSIFGKMKNDADEI